METTVSEILESDLLKDAKILAGRAGLSRAVSSVTIGEVPDIAEWLKGGELVLSTLYAVSEDTSDQLDFVRRIMARGAAAICLKPGRFVSKIRAELIKEAESAGFPIIEVPNEIRWTDLVRDIYDKMIKTEVEIRLKGDLIDDMLAHELKDSDVVRRAGFLGADLSGGSLALVFDIDDFAGAIDRLSLDEREAQRIKREALQAVTWSIRSYNTKSLVTLKGDEIIVLLPPPDDFRSDQLYEQADRLAKEIKDVFKTRCAGFTMSVGLGRYYKEPGALGLTYDEARTALEIGRTLEKSDTITAFESIGTYKALLTVYENAPEDLADLYARAIEPLAEYDRTRKADLVVTLRTFLALDMNLNRTAEALFTHRHTIRYRLDKIESLTGLSVNRAADLESLMLGLKAGRLIAGLAGDKNA